MGKINLKVNAERVFGKYLPAVFIERIEVDYPSDSTGGYETSKVEIVANYQLILLYLELILMKVN